MDRSKLVRCERHGTFYNPEKFDACAICRSSSIAEEPGGLRFSPFSIAGAVVFVVGLFFVIGKATRAVGDRGGDIAAQAQSDLRLDPEVYRASVEEIEALVYTDRPRSYGHGSEIMQAAFDLSQQIRETEGIGSLMQARRQQFGVEILSFGQKQAASEDIGYAAFNLAQARTDWEGVRESVFREADWFRAAEGSVPVAAATARSVMSPGTLRMLNDLATSLESTSRFGRQQALRIGELTGDRRSAEMRRVQEAWDSFRHSLDTRLSSAVSGLPHSAVEVSSNAERAHSYLEQAARSMSSLVAYSSVPTRSSRESAFENADRSIREAKRLLSSM